MCGRATLPELRPFLLFQQILFLILDCCMPWFPTARQPLWWIPAFDAPTFRPSSLWRQILPEGNCAAQLFWNTIGLRRKTVFLKRVCATDWSTIVWPRWMSPLSPHTTSRYIENASHFGFLRHRFRIENCQSALCWIQYKSAPQTFPHGFMLRLRPFWSLVSVRQRSHPIS